LNDLAAFFNQTNALLLSWVHFFGSRVAKSIITQLNDKTIRIYIVLCCNPQYRFIFL